MTREEAIEDLNRHYIGEATDIAIEALKQESILDTIRAEIMQLYYNIESVDYDYDDMSCTEEVHTICREEVLQIIDKHKSRK